MVNKVHFVVPAAAITLALVACQADSPDAGRQSAERIDYAKPSGLTPDSPIEGTKISARLPGALLGMTPSGVVVTGKNGRALGWDAWTGTRAFVAPLKPGLDTWDQDVDGYRAHDPYIASVHDLSATARKGTKLTQCPSAPRFLCGADDGKGVVVDGPTTTYVADATKVLDYDGRERTRAIVGGEDHLTTTDGSWRVQIDVSDINLAPRAVIVPDPEDRNATLLLQVG